MKKKIIILIMFIVFISFSCKRPEVKNPDYIKTFTQKYMMTLKTNPSTMIVYSSMRDVTDVTIKLTDSKGTPIPYGNVFITVTDNQLVQKIFGNFEGTLEASIIKKTNSQGEIKIKYYGPMKGEYIHTYFHIIGMYIGSDHNPITQAFKSSPIRLLWAE
jgi:hypothetical protein